MARAVLLDIDGVLTTSWKALPGAVELIRWLQSHDVAFRLLTNTSSKSRAEIAGLLGSAGMRIETEQILTAVSSAARFLAEHYPDRECFVVNEGDITEDLVGISLATDPAEVGVVLLGGAGPSIGYAELNRAYALIAAGTPVVALHRNTHFQTTDGPALDMGAFIVGLEAASNIEIPVVGKPAAAFFEAALATLGVDPGAALMVGDDIGSDVIGAQEAGINGVLVRTGKFRPTDLDNPSRVPDHVIDSIGQLTHLIESLG
jgi:HAD superfamily hydrolase (TIGR01458 family)